MSRAKLIELSRRALDGDEAAVASLRTEDVDVPDEALLNRAQNRINKIERDAFRVPFERPKAGFKAYHGTPYRFDEFDLEKIGTGEGAQAYGWGLYFATKKEVAEWYREGQNDNKVYVGGDLMEPGNPDFDAFDYLEWTPGDTLDTLLDVLLPLVNSKFPSGSKSFNTVMRGYALKNGLSLNEHGFHKKNGGKKEEKMDQTKKSPMGKSFL